MTQGIGEGCRGRHINRIKGLTTLESRGWGLGLAVAVLLVMSGVRLGYGAPGDLDPTFGAGGVAIIFGPQDSANALALQSDGKLVAAGSSTGDGINHILLARSWPDGRVDSSFGSGGKVTLATPSLGYALLLQSDGSLVVAGSALESPSDVLLVRYLPDGRLDASFGIGGSVRSHFIPNNFEEAHTLIQQPDGKLVAAGSSNILGAHFPTAILARYLSDGSLDPSFGIGGKVTVNFEGGSGINALAQQPDGKIVAAGLAGFSRVAPGFLVLARFQPDGRLDASFGQGGWVTLKEARSASALVLEPDGKLVVAGDSTTSSILLARYLSDGRLDLTFGTGGVAMTDVGGPTSPRALTQQPDGKLVVAGYRATSAPSDILLARYLPDGLLDPAFGAGGLVNTDVGGGELPNALLPQPDGNLVVAGWLSMGGANDILLARYQALGCPTVNPDPCLASLVAFVAEVYQAAFARQPDVGEETYWVDVLATEPTPETVRGMLHAVFNGPEFRERPVNPWQYVESLYQAILGRDPASSELDWWVQVVLDRLNTLLPEFISSPDFQRLVPSCQDQTAVTLLVGRLYQQTLQRVASADELAWWTQDIVSWCALEEAVESFFNTGEYLSVPRTLADHVTVLYQALLAREPDAGGLEWWVDNLAGQLAEIEDSIMASPEFEARVYRLFP